MNKTRIITFIVTLGVATALLGFFLISNQSEDRMLPEPASQHRTSIDLGMTYLQVTPQLSAYYGIGVESGAGKETSYLVSTVPVWKKALHCWG
jgi:hypothetical protein